MTENSIYIIIPEDAPPEARKELKELESQTYDEIHLILGIPFMLSKGLKYIPTILAWAFEEGGSVGDEHPKELSKKMKKMMLEIYKELASRVDVKIERSPQGGGGPSGLLKHLTLRRFRRRRSCWQNPKKSCSKWMTKGTTGCCSDMLSLMRCTHGR
ncbi:MAG: hypothetical protein QXI11_04860, partial [Thermoproteota archaeon]